MFARVLSVTSSVGDLRVLYSNRMYNIDEKIDLFPFAVFNSQLGKKNPYIVATMVEQFFTTSFICPLDTNEKFN